MIIFKLLLAVGLAWSTVSLASVEPRLRISFPPDAHISASDRLEVRGSVSDIQLLAINDTPVSIAKNGSFSQTITLKPNTYTPIVITAMSTTGKQLRERREVYFKQTKSVVPPPAKTPKPVVKAPAATSPAPRSSGPRLALRPIPKTSTSRTLTIKGKSTDVSLLTQNGKVVKLGPDGSFKTRIPLDRKPKTIRLDMVSSTGKHAQKTLRLPAYTPRLKKPAILLHSPQDQLFSARDKILVKGRVTNATSLSLNGQPLKLDKAGRFYYKMTLTKPNTYHPVKLVARRGKHKTVLARKVFYDQRKAPTFRALSPVDNAISTKKTLMVTGIVDRAARLTINGDAVALENGRFEHPYTFTRAKKTETIRLVAMSPGKLQTTKTLRVSYRPPLGPKPAFLQLSPVGKITTANDTIAITGQLANATTLKLNTLTLPIKPDGSFVIAVKLLPNTAKHMTLKAISSDGQVTTRRLSATFTPPPPAFVSLSPSRDTTIQSPTVRITGRVRDAKWVSINGLPVTIKKGGEFEFGVRLRKNRAKLFRLKARAKDGRLTTKLLRLTYAPPATDEAMALTPTNPLSIEPPSAPFPPLSLARPTLTISQPLHHRVVAENHVLVEGQTNVSQQIVINNQPYPVRSDGHFNATVKLPHFGRHTLAISASSGDTSLSRRLHVMRVPRRTRATVSEEVLKKRLNTTITMDLVDADIKSVLRRLAKKGRLNIVADKSLKGTVNISLSKVSLQSAIELILNTQGLAYKLVDNSLIVAPPDKLNQPTSIETALIKLDSMNGAEILRILTEYLAKGESAQLMKDDNIILIQADAKKIEKLLTLAQKMDSQTPPQIMLEAKIIETASTELQSLGINWPNATPYSYSYQDINGITNIQNSYAFLGVLNTLEEKGKAKILARPSIKVLHDEQAEIFIGDEVPYIETTVDQNGRLTESVKFVDLGITLKVKPIIKKGSREVTLDIAPEVSYIFAFRGSNNDIPWIKTRKVQTTVSVRDGNTVVIGGLFNSSDSESVSRLPFIGGLPIIGNLLFGTKKTDRTASELIITVTPTIVDENQTGR